MSYGQMNRSTTNLFRSHGKVKVWRIAKQLYDKKCQVETVKQGGSNVKVRDCLAWNGVY